MKTLTIIDNNWIKKLNEQYYGYPQWKFFEALTFYFNNVVFIAPVKKVKKVKKDEIKKLGLRLNNLAKIIELPYFEGTLSQIKRLYLIFYLLPVYFKYIKESDIIFIFGRDLFSTVALFLSKLLNKKTVFFVGDIWHKSLKEKYKSFLPIFAAKVLTAIQKKLLAYRKENSLILATLNKDIEKEIKDWKIDYKRYFASLIRENDIFYKEILPLKEKKVIKILYVGWLIEGKGVQDLIIAMSELQKELSNDLELHIVGNGYYEKTLKKLADDKNIKAIFHGFIGDREHIKNIYRECDIFVLPSYAEGYPKVVFEAASQGCLVITSDVVELEDICVKYKVKDVNALVSILKRAITDFQFFKSHVQRQYNVVKEYTLEKNIARIYKLLKEKWG